jgi:HlyD family secretion protein
MVQDDTQFEWTERDSLLPARPVRTVVITALALLASSAITIWVGSSDSQSYTGRVEAQVASIEIPTAGRVASIMVSEGEWVEPGRAIARLVDENLHAQRTALRDSVASLSAELQRARAQAAIDLQWRMQEIDTQILETRLTSAGLVKEQFASQIEAIAWRDFIEEFNTFNASATNDQIVTLLTEKKLLSEERRTKAMLQQASARNANEVFATQIRLCDDRLSQLKMLRGDLPEHVQQAAGVEEVQLRLAKTRSELQQLERRPEEFFVRATGYGTVGILRYKAGDVAAAGETLVNLLDDDRRFVSVRVPSRRLAEFASGSEVRLTFSEDDQRTGIVTSVSPEALVVDRDGRESSGQPMVEVDIAPSGKLWPQELIVGSAVMVSYR